MIKLASVLDALEFGRIFHSGMDTRLKKFNRRSSNKIFKIFNHFWSDHLKLSITTAIVLATRSSCLNSAIQYVIVVNDGAETERTYIPLTSIVN